MLKFLLVLVFVVGPTCGLFGGGNPDSKPHPGATKDENEMQGTGSFGGRLNIKKKPLFIGRKNSLFGKKPVKAVKPVKPVKPVGFVESVESVTSGTKVFNLYTLSDKKTAEID